MSEIDQDFINILICPVSKQSVQLADESLLQKINSLIQKKQLDNVGGNPVTETIDGGLLREDQQILYPIRQNIPILLANEGIRLDILQ